MLRLGHGNLMTYTVPWSLVRRMPSYLFFQQPARTLACLKHPRVRRPAGLVQERRCRVSAWSAGEDGDVGLVSRLSAGRVHKFDMFTKPASKMHYLLSPDRWRGRPDKRCGQCGLLKFAVRDFRRDQSTICDQCLREEETRENKLHLVCFQGSFFSDATSCGQVSHVQLLCFYRNAWSVTPPNRILSSTSWTSVPVSLVTFRKAGSMHRKVYRQTQIYLY